MRLAASEPISVIQPTIGVAQCEPISLIACIDGVSQPVRWSTIGAISSRSRLVIQIAGASERKTHTQITAQNPNAISQPTAARFSSRGSGGGSTLGRRRRRPWSAIGTALTAFRLSVCATMEA